MANGDQGSTGTRELPAVGEEVELPPGFIPDNAAPGGESARLPAIGEEVDAPAGPVASTAAPPAQPDPAAWAGEAPDLDERLRKVFQLGLQVSPSEAAGVNYLARELNLPPALVAQQYGTFQKAAEAAQFDPARFRRENPGLVELLLANPLSGIHPQQAEQVSGIFRAVRAAARLKDLGESFVAALGGPDPEGVRAAAVRRAVTGEPTPPPLQVSDEQVIPAPAMVPTRQSPLKGRTGLDTTAAMLAAEGKRGLLQNELGDVGYALLVAQQLGQDTEVLRRRQLEIEQELGVQVDYGQNALEQLLIDSEKAITSQWATVKEGGKGYAVGFGIGAAAGLGATRNPVQAARFGHAVGVILGKAAFSYGSFKQEAGSTFAQLLDEKMDDGTPLDRDVAKGIAFLYGVAAAAVEVYSFGELAKSLGPLKTMIEKGEGRAAIRSWVNDRSKSAILKQIGRQWAKSAASEGIEEGTQTTLQYAITWAGKSLSAGAPQTFDTEAFVREFTESIYLGTLGGMAMATPGSVVHATVRLQQFEGSRRRGELVRELVKVAGTEAALGAPQAVAELVTREAARAGAGPVTHAYIDIEAAEQFFQTQAAASDKALLEIVSATFSADLRERAQRLATQALASGSLSSGDVMAFYRLFGAFAGAAAARYGLPAQELLARYEVNVQPAAAVPGSEAWLEEAGGRGVMKASTRFNRRARGGERQLFLVVVSPEADAGTLPHEAGHIFLEILGDLGEVAGEDAAAEYGAVLAWLGVRSRAEIGAEQHELFAEAFASYVAEGDAPCPGVAGLFQRVLEWVESHREAAAALLDARPGLALPVEAILQRLGAGQVPLDDAARMLFARMLSAGPGAAP